MALVILLSSSLVLARNAGHGHHGRVERRPIEYACQPSPYTTLRHAHDFNRRKAQHDFIWSCFRADDGRAADAGAMLTTTAEED